MLASMVWKTIQIFCSAVTIIYNSYVILEKSASNNFLLLCGAFVNFNLMMDNDIPHETFDKIPENINSNFNTFFTKVMYY